jgi:glycerol-3-phosphate acyltransferase PlsY
MVWIEQLQSTNWVEVGRIGLGAYLLGCCTTGYYLVRWRTGQDIRELGSGSVGARNVSRVLGLPGFVLTVLGDFSKGVLAVAAAQHFTVDQKLVALAMLAVVAGHIWPAQLWLRGGKGMATSLGALCMYDFHLAVAFALLFGIGLGLVRKTIVPGLLALACLPFVSAYLAYNPAGHAYQSLEVLAVSILASIVLIAHRKNVIEEVINFLQRRNFRPKHTPPEL